jgi:hypothetical protein
MLSFQEFLTAAPETSIFNLKEALKTAGWTVPSSSDGTTYNAAGDQITSAGAGAGGMANNFAWFRIRSAGGQLEMIFQRASGTSTFRLKLGRAAFTAGAPSATQTPATASSSDEIVALGGGTDAAPTFANIATAVNSRMKLCVDDENARFYLIGFPDGGGACNCAVILERMLLADPEDTFPYVLYSPSLNRLASSSMQTGTTTAFATFLPVDRLGAPSRSIPGAANYRIGTQSTVPISQVVDPITGAFGLAAMPIVREGNTSTGQCWKGICGLMKWNAVTGAASGDTYSLDSARDRIVIGQAPNAEVNLPWDGSVPTNGAASTDRTASELMAFEDFYGLATVGATAAVYLMQAYDSVTGALFHWVSEFRDFTGLGYPGPNAPLDVAVSAINLS